MHAMLSRASRALIVSLRPLVFHDTLSHANGNLHLFELKVRNRFRLPERASHPTIGSGLLSRLGLRPMQFYSSGLPIRLWRHDRSEFHAGLLATWVAYFESGLRPLVPKEPLIRMVGVKWRTEN